MPDANRPSPLDRVVRGLPLLVAGSCAAAFLYALVWLRSFGLVYGNTTSARALVLAVLLGGLALGSALAARRPIADALRAYGLVEIGIGASALLGLPLMGALPWAHGALAGSAELGGTADVAASVALAAIVLLPATVMLGMTLPLATEGLVRLGRPVRASFGRLYVLSTLGGAVGVALAPLLLVPVLGVRGTLMAAAVGSLGVGALALYWRRGASLGTEPVGVTGEVVGVDPGSESSAPGEDQGTRRRVLSAGLAAVSGAAAFGIGVVWVRSYSLVLGPSVYAFHVTLLAVLVGVAGGGFAYVRLRTRFVRPARALGGLFAGSALAVLVGQWAIGGLPVVSRLALDVLPASFLAHQIAGFVLCLVTMLPFTLALGSTFPLLLHLTDADRASAQQASGRLCAWNAVGAVAGVLAADLVLVPRLGLQASHMVFAGLLLGAGAWAITWSAHWPLLVRTLVPIALVLVPAFLSPRWATWDPVLMAEAGPGGEDLAARKLVAHVPMLLHPEARRVLVIARGTGATVASAALRPSVESVLCVDMDPVAFEADPFFAEQALVDDPRLEISFGDGRSHLLRARESWDVILSEPSGPWIPDVSNLFTREFYEVVRGRLAPGGVFGQRLRYSNLDGPDVRVQVKTFFAVFPDASLWLVPSTTAAGETKSPPGDMLLVGSLEAHHLEWATLGERLGETPVGKDGHADRVLEDPLSLLATWVMGRAEMKRWVEAEDDFTSSLPLNTDDHPYLEFAAPKRAARAPGETARAAAAQYAALSEAAGDALTILSWRPGPDGDASAVAALHRDLAERYVDADQLGRAVASLDAAGAALPEDATAHVRAAELLLDRGHQLEALSRLREAVRRDPDQVTAWDLLGEVAIARKDYLLAESAHRAVLRREPGNVLAWLRLGAVLARQGEWREAREALRWAKRLDPDAPVDPALERFIVAKATEPTVVRRRP